MSANQTVPQTMARNVRSSGLACPTCDQDITANKWQEIQQRERKRLASERAAIVKELESKHREEIAAATRVAEKRATQEAQKKLLVITGDRDKVVQKVKQLEAREAAVRKQIQDDADRKIKRHEEEIAKQREAELRKQREILEKDRKQALLKKDIEFNREREGYQKKLSEMEQRLQRKTSNEIGEGSEVDLFEVLRQEFPGDRIVRVKKGEPGADIIHDVLYKGETCGRIVYDSKNRQQWRDTYVTKLRSDQGDAEAEQAILSTTVFPTGHKELCVRDGVIVINPARTVHMVRLLRAAIVKMHQQGLAKEERSSKMISLYKFIISDEYSRRIEESIKLTNDILDLDVQEKREHDKMWQKRGLVGKRLSKVLVEIDTEVRVILEGAVTDSPPQELE